MSRRLGGAALWAIVLPASALAQTAGAPFVASTDVRLVTLEVRASAGGLPVTDLGREDFTLLEDGRPVEIGHFAVIAPTGTKPSAAGPASVSAPPVLPSPANDKSSFRLAVLLDNAHLSPASRGRALVEIRRFLSDRLPPDSLVSLVSVDPGLHVRVPFTASVRRVLEALERLELYTAQGMSAALERHQALQNIREHLRVTIERPSPGDPPCCNHLGDFAHQYASSDFGRAQGSLAALGTYVASLAGLPGRKAVLHVSDGLPLLAGLPAFQLASRLCDGSGAMQGEQWALDVGLGGPPVGDLYNPRAATLEMQRYSSVSLLDAVAAAANAHGVTLYMLQSSGPGRSEFASASADGRGTDMVGLSAEAGNAQDVLFSLADETGGKAIFDHADLGAALGSTASELGTFYVLGFYPQRRGDDRSHRLEVKTRRPGVRLRYARSFRDTAPDTSVAEAVLGTLLQGTERSDFPLALESQVDSASAGGPRQTRLRIRVPLHRLTLFEQSGVRHGSFTAFIAVLRPDGSILRVRQKTVPVAVPSAAPATYLYEVRLDLPPGEHVVAVAVRDDLGDALAVQRAAISVPRRGS